MRILRWVVTVLLLAAGWQVWGRRQAIELANLETTAALAEAIARDASNPEIHLRLGRMQRDSVSARNLPAARASLERAVELRPKSAHYLAELSSLYESMDLLPEAQSTMERTLERNPLDAPYLWRLANLYLRAGSLEQAVPLFARAMNRDSDLRDAGLSLLLKAGVEAARIEELWPEGSGLAERLLNGLLRSRHRGGIDVDPAVLDRQWRSALEEDEPPTPPQASGYLRYLADEGRWSELRAAWEAIQQRQGVEIPAFSQGRTTLWNGDFETPFGGGLLAWRVANSPDVLIERISGAGPGGTAAVAIDFRGGSKRIAVLHQQFVVDAATEYELSLAARAERLTGSGLLVEITARGRPSTLSVPLAMQGTTEWESLSARFGPLDASGALTLRVRTNPREGRPGPTGRLWLDKLTVEPKTDRKEDNPT